MMRQQHIHIVLLLLLLSSLFIVSSFTFHPTTARVVPPRRAILRSFDGIRRQRQTPRRRTEEVVVYSSSSSSSDTVGSNSSSSDVGVNALRKQLQEDARTDVASSSSSSETIQDEDVATTTTVSGGVVPSYQQLVIFCATTVLIWLSEPLLSLIDATVVGLTQKGTATVQLAALGPATTLIDSLLYLTYFLSIATTNRIAAELAVGNNHRQLLRTTSHVLGVAVLLGIVTTLFCFGFATPILTQMAGRSGTPELIGYATRYTCIRATAAVAAVTGITMQSFCLANLDVTTPAMAVAAASITNIVGDVLLARPFGVQGAAVATAAASVVSTSLLWGAVRRKVQSWRQAVRREIIASESSSGATIVVNGNPKPPPQAMMTNTTLPTTATNATAHIVESENETIRNDDSVRRHSEANETAIQRTTPAAPVATAKEVGGNKESTAALIPPMCSLPDRKAAIELIELAGPIFFVIMAKVLCYGAMTIRCTAFGVAALAAHSIMMRIFFFFGCFGDSLSQTAQSFLPATLYPKPSPRAFGKIFKRLLLLTAAVGTMNSQTSVLILKRMGQYLTKDVAIIDLMRSHTGFMGLSILLHPFIMLLEGTVIASRDFATLIFTYTATLGLHFSILKCFSDSFPAVWRTFFLFQCTRLGLYAWRVLKRQGEIRKEDANSGGDGDGAAVVAPSRFTIK